MNETTGGQLNAPLLHLALEEGVGEQGDPIEKEQGRDAIALQSEEEGLDSGRATRYTFVRKTPPGGRGKQQDRQKMLDKK